MPIYVTAEAELIVGQPSVIEGPSPEGSLSAVFEDNETSGYFYALDKSAGKQRIQDTLHIYDVADVTDRSKPSLVTIGWSTDCQKVVLLIDDHPHAIFDFASKQGYCRTGLPSPPSNGIWSKGGHEWQEDATELFA
jgi:hypothetical protein